MSVSEVQSMLIRLAPMTTIHSGSHELCRDLRDDGIAVTAQASHAGGCRNAPHAPHARPTAACTRRRNAGRK